MNLVCAILVALHAGFAPLAVRVQGEGYFRFLRQGRPVYARQARLESVDGCLGMDGAKLLPAVAVPDDAVAISIDESGRVTASTSDGDRRVGRIVLALIPKTAKLESSDGFLLVDERPELAAPGEGAAGFIEPAGSKPTLPKSAQAPGRAAPASPGAAGGGEPEIIVRPHSDIDAATFTLGDVAEVTGPPAKVAALTALKLGNTAVLGTTRVLDAKLIALRLLGAGYQPDAYVLVVPEGADLTRKSQTVGSDEIVAKAEDAIETRFGGKLDLSAIGTVRPIVALSGEVQLAASDPQSSGKNFVVTITARQGDQIIGTRTLTLAPGPGAVAIKPGDPVEVLMKAGTAQVQVSGRAQTGGYLGQQVLVVVSGVGAKPTTHTGTLVGPGKVEVDL